MRGQKCKAPSSTQPLRIDTDRLMSPGEVAGILGARDKTERRRQEVYLASLRFRGEGPRFIRHGRKILYWASDIDAWLRAGERQCTRYVNDESECWSRT